MTTIHMLYCFRPVDAHRAARQRGPVIERERVQIRLRLSSGVDARIRLCQWRLGQSGRQVARLRRLEMVQERNANNQVTAQLVRDGNIGGILSRTTAEGHAFYGYDGQVNVALLTNSAGQDVGHYRYDAFGNTLEEGT